MYVNDKWQKQRFLSLPIRTAVSIRSLCSFTLLVLCCFPIASSFPEIQPLAPLRNNNLPLFNSRRDVSTEKTTAGGGRVNIRVREIMDLLQSRLDPSSSSQYSSNRSKLDPKWSRCRNYLYHRTDLTANQVLRVVEFLEDVLHKDQETVATVIQENPRILRKSAKTYLQPLSKFLKRLYGDDMFQEAVRRNPSLLLARGVGFDAPEELTVSLDEYMVSSLGLRDSDLASLKEKAPYLFQRSLDHIQDHVMFWDRILQHSKKSENSRKQTIGKLLISYPTLFNCSVLKGLAPKVDFLQKDCGLSMKDVASLLEGHKAAVFCLSIDNKLRPFVTLLGELLHDDDQGKAMQNIQRCIVAHPNILCVSKEKMTQKISYFDSIDSLCKEKPKKSLASRMALRCPTVYSLSLKDNIIPKVEFLAKIWDTRLPGKKRRGAKSASKTDPPRLATFLSENPNILTTSLQGNLQPTVNFYNRTGYIFLDEDWNLLTASGSERESMPIVRSRHISSSLFKRLLPRWHFYLRIRDEQRISEGFSQGELKKPPLHILAVSGDKEFCYHLGVNIEEFQTFKEEQIPRLKFSSQFDTWLKTGRPIE